MVRERCLRDKTSFEFIDIHVRVFAHLPRTKLALVFAARNAALDELDEEFHLFGQEQKLYRHLREPVN
jgi:hypothetical protein